MPILRFNGVSQRVLMHVKPAGSADGRAVVLFIEGGAVKRSRKASRRRATPATKSSPGCAKSCCGDLGAAADHARESGERQRGIACSQRGTAIDQRGIPLDLRGVGNQQEELQSINEELQTVNSELKLKLEAVSRAHSDLQNLMAATDFGTKFLDSSLRIKRFTQQVTELFSVTPTDEGRPISDFAHQLEYDGLVADARRVLSNLTPISYEIRARNDRWYDVRLRPYRTVDDKIDGVVLTFVDMTDRRQTEEALRLSERKLRQETQLVELSRDPIFIWEFGGTILQWNRGGEQLLRRTAATKPSGKGRISC